MLKNVFISALLLCLIPGTALTGIASDAHGPPVTSTATEEDSLPEHLDQCLACHDLTALHEETGHNGCRNCHDGPPRQGGAVALAVCAQCHPAADPGTCALAIAHVAAEASLCTGCHIQCDSGTTTTPGSSTTSTVSATDTHISICLQCHMTGDLHAKPGHALCADCHDGTPGEASVEPGACAVCHPGEDPGTCPLAELHGPSCRSCHIDCLDVSTTSTSPPSTTTTVAASAETHIDICAACHYPADLHEKHTSCGDCHDGEAAAGNVAPLSCTVCHPSEAPGTCALVSPDIHGATCVTCHYECDNPPGTTTTTSFASGDDPTDEDTGEAPPVSTTVPASVPADCTHDSQCSDDVFCNGSEICLDGACAPGAAPCTDQEICDEAAGTCLPQQPPPAACATDADCDDGLYCTGAAFCIDGQCVPGDSPCADNEICRETLESCYERRDIASSPFQKTLNRPVFVRTRCTCLVVRCTENTHVSPDSLISLSGNQDNATGVTVNTQRRIKTPGRFLLIPICISNTATSGTWTLRLQSDVAADNGEEYVEQVETTFRIR